MQASTSAPQPIASRAPSGRSTSTPSTRRSSFDEQGRHCRLRQQRRGSSFDRGCADGRPAPAPDATRQAVHAARAMAGIVEIMHHRERQAVAVGEPFDGRAGLARDEPNERFVGLAVRLGLDVAREQIRRNRQARARAGSAFPRPVSSPADSAVEPRGTMSRSIRRRPLPRPRAPRAPRIVRRRPRRRPPLARLVSNAEGGGLDRHRRPLAKHVGDGRAARNGPQRRDRGRVGHRVEGGAAVGQHDRLDVAHMRVAHGRGDAAVGDDAADDRAARRPPCATPIRAASCRRRNRRSSRSGNRRARVRRRAHGPRRPARNRPCAETAATPSDAARSSARRRVRAPA